MSWLAGLMVIVTLFVLRLGAPLTAILVAGYFLRRLETKWQASVG